MFAAHASAAWGADMSIALVFDGLLRAGLLNSPKRSGGSHDTDWRCPACHHFNSIKRLACGECKSPGPWNGRLTRAALRARQKEHATAAILRKHGL